MIWYKVEFLLHQRASIFISRITLAFNFLAMGHSSGHPDDKGGGTDFPKKCIGV